MVDRVLLPGDPVIGAQQHLAGADLRHQMAQTFLSRGVAILAVPERIDRQHLHIDCHRIHFLQALFDGDDLFALSTSQLVAPLTSVAVSVLSRLNRISTEYRRSLLGALEVTAFLSMAVGADLTLIGKDVIRVLLGSKWDESGRIFMFFGPGIGVMLLYYTHGWIHLSIGRADRWLRRSLIEFATTATVFLVGRHWGPIGIALAWTASFWILVLPALWYAGRPINFGIGPVVAIVWRYVAASLVAGGAAEVIICRLPSSIVERGGVSAVARIAAISLMFGVLYLGAVVSLQGGFARLFRLLRLVRELLPHRSSSKSFSGGAVNLSLRSSTPAASSADPL